LGTRIESVAAYIKAFKDSEKLLRVCADVSGDAEHARAAIAAEFEVSDIAADAIPAPQVRRFTPRAIEQMRSELADYHRRLVDLDRPQAGPSTAYWSALRQIDSRLQARCPHTPPDEDARMGTATATPLSSKRAPVMDIESSATDMKLSPRT
jgi:hypothetical protein